MPATVASPDRRSRSHRSSMRQRVFLIGIPQALGDLNVLKRPALVGHGRW